MAFRPSAWKTLPELGEVSLLLSAQLDHAQATMSPVGLGITHVQTI